MSTDKNPFESPQADRSSGATDPRAGVCPFCGASDYREPRFTWWGGAVGHKIISHVICNQCSKGFNRKSGKDNFMPILLYNLFAFVVIFPIALVFFYMLFNN